MKRRILKFYRPDENGGGEAPPAPEPPTPAPTTIVQDAPDELVQPVIDHTERLTRLEERQAQHEVDVMRRLDEAESRINENVSSRLSALEEAARAAAAAAAEAAAAPVEETEELAEDEIEVPRVAPEKRKGIRGRRKARRNK